MILIYEIWHKNNSHSNRTSWKFHLISPSNSTLNQIEKFLSSVEEIDPKFAIFWQILDKEGESILLNRDGKVVLWVQ